MKKGTENKLKFKKLSRALETLDGGKGLAPIWKVKGVLQSLWDFVCDNCPAGNIGRFSNEDIALGIGWEKDPDALIKILIENNWIDECPNGSRLLVHNWHAHCENSVHTKMARAFKYFACGRKPKMTGLGTGHSEIKVRWEKMPGNDIFQTSDGKGVTEDKLPITSDNVHVTLNNSATYSEPSQAKPIPKPIPGATDIENTEGNEVEGKENPENQENTEFSQEIIAALFRTKKARKVYSFNSKQIALDAMTFQKLERYLDQLPDANAAKKISLARAVEIGKENIIDARKPAAKFTAWAKRWLKKHGVFWKNSKKQ